MTARRLVPGGASSDANGQVSGDAAGEVTNRERGPETVPVHGVALDPGTGLAPQLTTGCRQPGLRAGNDVHSTRAVVVAPAAVSRDADGEVCVGPTGERACGQLGSEVVLGVFVARDPGGGLRPGWLPESRPALDP